ncbi:MAG: hypothetical protein PHX21_13530 [bacterium]|nr:hypothetical protein [bacterium]
MSTQLDRIVANNRQHIKWTINAQGNKCYAGALQFWYIPPDNTTEIFPPDTKVNLALWFYPPKSFWRKELPLTRIYVAETTYGEVLNLEKKYNIPVFREMWEGKKGEEDKEKRRKDE